MFITLQELEELQSNLSSYGLTDTAAQYSLLDSKDITNTWTSSHISSAGTGFTSDRLICNPQKPSFSSSAILPLCFKTKLPYRYDCKITAAP